MMSPHNSCGPTSACYIAATHDPVKFVQNFIELWQTGKANDGKIKANKTLLNWEYNQANMDIALIGSLRNAQNLFFDYNPLKDGDKNQKRNATTPMEYVSMLDRLGLDITAVEDENKIFDYIKNFTDFGIRVVAFGYYEGFIGTKPENRTEPEAIVKFFWGGSFYNNSFNYRR